MNTSSRQTLPLVACDVWFSSDMLFVRLSDGREVGVPLEWFPRLKKASREDRNRWKLIGRGIGIRWENLDEDISVQSLIHPEMHAFCIPADFNV